MQTNPSDRVYKSKAGFFEVWRLKTSFGIYNRQGIKVAQVPGIGDARAKKMAELIADAIEVEFQW